jgi:putative ABC transport system permease protein
MPGLWRDLRFGLRMLAKSPGFATVAILTLALGIGANTAIFQLIDAVRLRTLPVKDPHSLAIVHLIRHHWAMGSFTGPYAEFTFPLWRQIRQRQKSFSSLAAWGTEGFNLANGGEVDNAHGIWVSGEFFSSLGVRPILGRLIADSDDQPGCSGGVNISYSFWQRRYGGAASAVGRVLTLDGHPFPILGVTLPGFFGVAVGNRFDVAVPVCADPILHPEYPRLKDRRFWWLSIFGRLKPGWTLTRATAQLKAIAPAALHETIPPQYDASGVKHYLAYSLEARSAANGFSALREAGSTSLWLLLGLSGLVLLIACANLANLLLARASARERETAVRLALGATRSRLIRQLLSESAMLAVAGAALGGLLAWWLSRWLVVFISTAENSIYLNTPTDWRVFGFAAFLAVATTFLFGLAPALRAGNSSPGLVLKTSGRGMTAGRSRFRLQRILVASQVALSLVLLAGALLFAHSLLNLLTRNPGFQQNGVLVENVDFSRLKLPVARRYAFERNLLDRIRSIPGVVSAAAAERSPISGNSSNDGVLDEKTGKSKEVTWLNWISPGYFQTLETPLLAGRDFRASDSGSSPKVAIVNQAFVKKFFPGHGHEVVGKQFRLWASPGKPEPYYTIIGVVKNMAYQDLHSPFVPVAYLARAQVESAEPAAAFLIRSRLGPATLFKSVKDATVGVNPEIDIQFTLLHKQIRESLVQDELMATLCGFFGVLAVLLAAIGLYGVISYTVAQRTNEMGIRMALGAHRGNVLRLVLGEVAVLAAIGIVAGAALTLAGGKAASSMLYGLSAHDPATLALAIIVLAAVALGASLVPARRASRMHPMDALRYE